MFAAPVDSPEGVAACAEAGLNCVVLEARPEFGPADWERLEALLGAARERGLYVCLATVLFWPGREPMPFDPGYRAAIGGWLRGVAARYGRLPHLLGWQIAPGSLQATHGDPGAFQQFLRERYPTLQALNQGWGSQYQAWEDIEPSTEVGKSNSPFFPSPGRVAEGAYYMELYRRLVVLWAESLGAGDSGGPFFSLSLIHISEPTRPY